MYNLRRRFLPSFAYQRNEVSLLHDLRQLLSPVRAGLDLVPEEVAGREVRESVLGHDALALGALPASGPAWKECMQGGQIQMRGWDRTTNYGSANQIQVLYLIESQNVSVVKWKSIF